MQRGLKRRKLIKYNYMKFLAWDIGIKNLAYNLIDYQPDKVDPYVIQKWGVINLVNEVDEIANGATKSIKCDGILKSGKPCQQKSKFVSSLDRYIGYCTKHGNEINSQLSKTDLVPVKSKMTCVFKVIKKNETTQCHKSGYWLQDDNPYICYCQTHLKNINNIESNKHQYYLSPKRAQQVKQFNIKELSVKLFDELAKFGDDFLIVDEVIIENQPLKNPTMRSVQFLLYSYFVINGLMKNTINNISFFMAGKKLEAFTGDHDIAKQQFGHIKSTYKQTKNSAILFCKEMIKNSQPEWHNYIINHLKQDDLADTFLMNCHHVQNNYIKKIEKEKKKLALVEKKKQALEKKQQIAEKKKQALEKKQQITETK
jgi:hypothetical protein